MPIGLSFALARLVCLNQHPALTRQIIHGRSRAVDVGQANVVGPGWICAENKMFTHEMLCRL